MLCCAVLQVCPAPPPSPTCAARAASLSAPAAAGRARATRHKRPTLGSSRASRPSARCKDSGWQQQQKKQDPSNAPGALGSPLLLQSAGWLGVAQLCKTMAAGCCHAWECYHGRCNNDAESCTNSLGHSKLSRCEARQVTDFGCWEITHSMYRTQQGGVQSPSCFNEVACLSLSGVPAPSPVGPCRPSR